MHKHQIHKDFGAFRAKMSLIAVAVAAVAGPAFAAGVAVCYEQRDEPSIASIAEAIDKINTAFSEYKKTNDERIEAIKKGLPTADFDAKLAKMDEHMDALNEQKSRLEKMETKLARPGAFGGAGGGQGEAKEETEYKNAFLAWTRNPGDHKTQQRLQERARDLQAYEAKQREALGLEQRAASVVVGTPTSGGYALPKVIESTIARLSVDISPIRQIATVRQTSTTDYHEIFDINGAAFEWVGEGDARDQTNTSDMADIQPTFGMASAKPQASEESLNDLFFDVESWLTMSAGEAIGQGEGAAFVNGNGAKKPTGILAGPAPVATADAGRAFGTLQYVASGQAAAMPASPDTFYDLIYALRARYRANSRWLTSKAILSALRKYKDTTNAYLWQPSLVDGQPDKFMGYPVVEAEDMPAVAANAFPIAFGDFREGYLIVDLVGMRITRDEITTPGQVKFYIRKRVGGKLRNTQAIKLLKIAAA